MSGNTPLLTLQETWLGWVEPSHITTALGERCSGQWEVQLRPDKQNSSLAIRLCCPVCTAQHVYATASWEQQATTARQSGFNRGHRDMAGVRLWPGPESDGDVEGQSRSYLVTRPGVRRPERAEVIGEVTYDAETGRWEGRTRPADPPPPQLLFAETEPVTFLWESTWGTLEEAASWVARRRRRRLDAETIRRLAGRTPWWGVSPCASCGDDHEIHEWMTVDRYNLVVLDCDRQS
ncbi:hypothetical protein [Streptomyces sp. NRRL S-350]|uniref:hypothetical protein n=1 Tax=Streptomyces sp. NRRL S-350 TaxID=1463902 RepID=UPI0004C28275|nr:hypothetical protein [Streptomyces sp. NRRL S-350]